MRTWLKRIILACMIIQSYAAFSQEFTLPAFIDDITSCDIDLDGDADIICICQILNYDEDSIFIFYNNGAGAFQRIGYHYPNSGFILCGCIDGNEFPDLITRLSFNVFYVPNNGLEGFGEMVTIDDNMGGNLSVISDINNDNWNDLVFSVTDYENWGVYKNIDGLVFTKKVIQSGSSTTTPAVGYITDDSLPDIVLTYSAFDRSSVHVNNNNFNFTEVVLEQTFIGESFIMNIDNQETEDFAFLISYSKSIALYKFIGNDQFERQANFYAEGNYIISTFLPADFNQDGYDDFAITRGDWWNGSDSLYLYFNDHNWSFYLNQILYIGELNWFKSCSADLNGDSYPDIFMKNYNGSNILTLLWNDGNGNFSFENPVGIIESQNGSPISISVSPNPFRDQVNITVNAEITFDLNVTVYDILRRKVKGLQPQGFQPEGWKPSFTWNGHDDSGLECPTGVYVVVAEVDNFRSFTKVVKSER